MRDWVQWHEEYQDPTSYLSQRLTAVTTSIREALAGAAPGPIRLLSLCAGEGRDVIAAARDHPRAAELDGCLVELDPRLAARARAAAGAAALRIDVRQADAGDPQTFVDRLPVDVLVLVGIFGNVVDQDVRTTVASVPVLCRDGATVIWTRHRKAPDLTPVLREWFAAAGCEEVSFVSPGPELWSVGVQRVVRGAPRGPLPPRLFRFADELPAR